MNVPGLCETNISGRQIGLQDASIEGYRGEFYTKKGDNEIAFFHFMSVYCIRYSIGNDGGDEI